MASTHAIYKDSEMRWNAEKAWLLFLKIPHKMYICKLFKKKKKKNPHPKTQPEGIKHTILGMCIRLIWIRELAKSGQFRLIWMLKQAGTDFLLVLASESDLYKVAPHLPSRFPQEMCIFSGLHPSPLWADWFHPAPFWVAMGTKVSSW